jgi:hypothetical protein
VTSDTQQKAIAPKNLQFFGVALRVAIETAVALNTMSFVAIAVPCIAIAI